MSGKGRKKFDTFIKEYNETLIAHEREVKDVVSDLLNDVQRPVKSRHVHVFRLGCNTCLIRGCYSTPSGRAEDSRYG